VRKFENDLLHLIQINFEFHQAILLIVVVQVYFYHHINLDIHLHLLNITRISFQKPKNQINIPVPAVRLSAVLTVISYSTAFSSFASSKYLKNKDF